MKACLIFYLYQPSIWTVARILSKLAEVQLASWQGYFHAHPLCLNHRSASLNHFRIVAYNFQASKAHCVPSLRIILVASVISENLLQMTCRRLKSRVPTNRVVFLPWMQSCDFQSRYRLVDFCCPLQLGDFQCLLELVELKLVFAFWLHQVQLTSNLSVLHEPWIISI